MGRLTGALEDVPLTLLGILLFAMFWMAALFGRWLHRRATPDKAGDPGLIVSSSLGLLALLLGFTVSMAVELDRYGHGLVPSPYLPGE